MKPEQLKVIAEGMELFPNYITTDGILYLGSPTFGGSRYYPLTNNDQMVEIMEKLKESLTWDDWGALMQIMYEEEETINEAVCNAAFEYFNKDEP